MDNLSQGLLSADVFPRKSIRVGHWFGILVVWKFAMKLVEKHEVDLKQF